MLCVHSHPESGRGRGEGLNKNTSLIDGRLLVLLGHNPYIRLMCDAYSLSISWFFGRRPRRVRDHTCRGGARRADQ